MSKDGFVQVPPNSTGGKVDCASLSVAGQVVVRQRIVIGDNASSANFATVTGGGLNVNPGAVAISGTAIVAGAVTVSGTIDKISATVAVSGQVSLGPGTSNIGSLNNISATVTVAGNVSVSVVGTVPISGTLDKISATVTVAGNLTIGGTVGGTSATAGSSFTLIGGTDGSLARGIKTDANGNLIINNISATVSVVGNLTVGGTAGGTSATAGSSFTLIGGTDGSFARGIKTDANGNLVINNISASVAVTLPANIGTVNNISAAVVLAAGGNNIGTINNISAGVVLAAGAANIGFINNISATVTVAGNLTIGGTAGGTSATAGSSFTLIGGTDGSFARGIKTDANGNLIVNNISATVTVQGNVSVSVVGNINISNTPSVVLATGTNNIGTIQAISAQVAVSGSVNIINNINISAMPNVVLAAGTNNIGTIQAISATVNVNIAAQSAGLAVVVQGPIAFNASITAANNPVLMGGRVKTSASTTATAHSAVFLWMDKAGRQIIQNRHPSLPPSTTHGPASITLSGTASTVLVASAGTAAIFVNSLLVTSNLAGVVQCDIFTAGNSATPEVSAYLGIGGGGYNREFDPPWQISAGQPLVGRLVPSSSAQVIVCVHFHVGPV